MKDKDTALMNKLEDDYKLYCDNVLDKITVDDKRDTDKVIKLIKEMNRNQRQRERIIDALGGKEFCETIPIIVVDKLDDYLHFNVEDEDKTGRKGLLLKLKNKTTQNFEIIWLFQRYRETSSSGELWMANGAIHLEGVDAIVKFLNQIKPVPHKTYELAL